MRKRSSIVGYCYVAGAILLSLAWPAQTYAQKSGTPSLRSRVFYSDFSDNKDDRWPVQNTASQVLLPKDEALLWKLNSNKEVIFSYPRASHTLAYWKYEAYITKLDKGKGMYGIAMESERHAGQEWMLMLDNKGAMRLVVRLPDGREVPLTGTLKNEGWIEVPSVSKGKESVNCLAMMRIGEQLVCYVNQNVVHVATIKEREEGLMRFGLVGQGKMKLSIDDVAVYDLERDAPTEIGDPKVEAQSTDIEDCKKALEESYGVLQFYKADRNDQYRLRRLAEEYIRSYVDTTLATRVAAAEKEVAALRMENEDLKGVIKLIEDGGAGTEIETWKKKYLEERAENQRLSKELDELKKKYKGNKR